MDVVVPAYNEAHVLGRTIPVLHEALAGWGLAGWRIVIVDDGSIDGTAEVATTLAATRPEVVVRQLPHRGRGHALRAAWALSDAEVVAYMDADLSTDLAAFPRLLAAIVEEGHDIAIGSRLVTESKVTREPVREVLSRGYNALLQLALRVPFRDAQCGFKAVRTSTVRDLLPLVEDDGWFFDTELLVVAVRSGLSVAEVPVRWVDDSDSRVRIVTTVAADLCGVGRLLLQRRRLSRMRAQ